MQKFQYYLLPVLIYILSLLPGTLHSQSAFVQLPDATGYAHNTPQHLLDSLQSASSALQTALPSAYQSDFAVYDLGFYSHHRSYEGGLPGVLQEAIEDLSTPYYLIFGREFNLDDELERVWVEVELPHTADFCFWEDGTFSHLKFMIETRANSVRGLSMSKQGVIFDAMKQSMKVRE